MHKEIKNATREIIDAFNFKAKDGIEKIKTLCAQHQIVSVEQEIADFFIENKANLNLIEVGEYLGTGNDFNKNVLERFTAQMNFSQQSFTGSLRTFLAAFKLPGEAQKIGRLVECFGNVYCQQHPDGSIADGDAAYVLAYAVLMLQTSLHNSNISTSDKLNFEKFKTMLVGANAQNDFDEGFLKELYDDISERPLEYNFTPTIPGYEFNVAELENDATFAKLDLLLHSLETNIADIFSGIGEGLQITVNKPKSWLNLFTGYEGTLTVTQDGIPGSATIQVYKPGIFSQWLFGDQPKLFIQPEYQENNTQQPIQLAAKIAASFQASLSNVNGTYDYEKKELISAYRTEKKLDAPESSLAKNPMTLFKSEEKQLENDAEVTALNPLVEHKIQHGS